MSGQWCIPPNKERHFAKFEAKARKLWKWMDAGADAINVFHESPHRSTNDPWTYPDMSKLNSYFWQIAAQSRGPRQGLISLSLKPSGLYDPQDKSSLWKVRRFFTSLIGQGTVGNFDFVVAEGFTYPDELSCALDVIKGVSVASVVTLSVAATNPSTKDQEKMIETLNGLKAAGATVVGMTCDLRSQEVLKMMKLIASEVEGPLAVLPIYQKSNRILESFKDTQITAFYREAYKMGFTFFGVDGSSSGRRQLRLVSDLFGKKYRPIPADQPLPPSGAFMELESFTLSRIVSKRG